MKLKKPRSLRGHHCDIRAEFLAELNLAFKLYQEPLPEPPEMYHYSSLAGAKGILQSGVLWASDLRSMKDPSEIRYAAKMLSQVAVHFPDCVELVREELSDAILELGLHLSCLSMRRDLRRQWHDYADACRGCAIVFDTTEVRKVCSSGNKIIGFPLAYDPSQQARMFEMIFEKASQLQHLVPKRHLLKVHLEMLMMLGSVLTVVKNPDCWFEHEWRLQILELDQFKKVIRNDGSTSRELPVCTSNTVTGLLLGPECSMSIEDAQQLLIDTGFPRASASRVAHSELT